MVGELRRWCGYVRHASPVVAMRSNPRPLHEYKRAMKSSVDTKNTEAPRHVRRCSVPRQPVLYAVAVPPHATHACSEYKPSQPPARRCILTKAENKAVQVPFKARALSMSSTHVVLSSYVVANA